MAIRYRTAAGNWSNAAQWNGGTLPGATDDVYLNNQAVTLDQDVTVLSINHAANTTPAITAGGTLTIAAIPGGGRSITANLNATVTGVNLVAITATTGTLTVTGNVVRGNTGNGGNAISCGTLTGVTLIVNGNVQPGSGGANSGAIVVGCNVTINGNATGIMACTAMTVNAALALNVTVTGTVNNNGLSLAGAGAHLLTVANVANTTAGFSGSSVYCISITSALNPASTITGAGTTAAGLAMYLSLAHTSGSVTVNLGSGDVIPPTGINGQVIACSMAAAASATINCRYVNGSTAGSNAGTIQLTTAGSLTINCTAVRGGTGTLVSYTAAVINGSTGTLTINGDAIGASSGGGQAGAANIGAGTMIINGTAYGGTSTAAAANGAINQSNGVLRITNVKSNDYPNAGMTQVAYGAINNAWTGWLLVDSMEDGSGGVPAYTGRCFIRNGSNGQVKMRESNAGTIKTFGANPTDYPVPANVRDGTAYNSGAQTGTLKVPPVGSVAVGVPVDATVGTAVLNGATLAQIEASTVLAKKAHVDAVPAAVRTELSTELGHMDASVSTRATQASVTAIPTTPLLAATYVAPDNAGIAAIKAKTDQLAFTGALVQSIATTVSDKTGYSLTSGERDAISVAVQAGILNEGDGQQILNAIVGAIGNLNVDQVALVAAIRADLERVGGTLATRASQTSVVAIPTNPVLATDPRLSNLDAEVSSRLSASSYVEPVTPPTASQNALAVRAELALELGRVDVAVSSRATQASVSGLATQASVDAVKADTGLIPAALEPLGF